MTERRLVLVRHGVTDWNREGRFQGHRDPGLADAGRLEAELVATRIAGDAGLRPARLITSSLGRAVETAEAIARRTGVELELDPRLMEIGQGEWEGRTHAELEATDPDRYREWREASGVRQPPGGEAIEHATERVRSFLADLGGPWPVCLVSHGGTLRIVAHALFRLDDARSLDVDNASIGLATLAAGAWRLDRWNDALHLLGRELTHVDEFEGRPLAL